MPTAVDNLTSDSSDEAVKAAISSCISAEVSGGREQEQAVAMCHSMARKKTGGRPAQKGVGGKTSRRIGE